MNMDTKILKGLACGLTAALLLAGCSGEEQSSSSTNTPADLAEEQGSASTNTPADLAEEQGSASTNTPADFKGNVGDVSIESGDTYAVITIKDYGAITCKLFPEAAPVGVQNFISLADSGYYSGKEIHRVVEDFMFQGGSANGDGMSAENEPAFDVEYNTNMRHFYGALCYANAGGINGTQFYIVNSKNYSFTSEEDLQGLIDQLDNEMSELEKYIASASSDDEKSYYQSYYDYYSSLKKTTQSQLKAAKEMTDEMKAKYEKVGGTPSLDGGYTVFGQTVDGFDVIDEISKAEVEAQPNSSEVSHPVQTITIESVEIFTKE